MSRIKNYFEEIKIICAVVVLLFGLTLLFFAFWVDPTGIIDNSVLIAVGETFTFAGSVFSIDTVYSSKFKKFMNNNKNE